MSQQQSLLRLKQHVSEQILGQPVLVDRLLIALLADGHLLVEGAPGLAKTRAIKVLSDGIEGDFRMQEWCGACFSPDGQWLFANLQTPGITLAITGPWQELGL